MPIDKDVLKEMIKQAFSDAPYPGDDKIVSHQCEECFGVAKIMRGKNWRDWQDKPMQLIPRYKATLSFLTPEAFRYFLPLFFFAILEDYQETGLVLESLISSFIRPTNDEWQQGVSRIANPAAPAELAEQLKDLQRDLSNQGYPESEMLKGYEDRLKVLTPQQIQAARAFIGYLQSVHGVDDFAGRWEKANRELEVLSRE